MNFISSASLPRFRRHQAIGLCFLIGLFGLLAGIPNYATAQVSLFNGKDLTGWVGDGYVVKDGSIVCTPQGKELYTEKQYTNYQFEFEFKLPPGGNNGIGIHYPGHGVSAHTGIELQILDDSAPQYQQLKDYQFHGGVYGFKAPQKGHLNPVGEWNTQKITVFGPLVVIELNGQTINVAHLDHLASLNPKHQGIKRRSGHISLSGHNDPVAFRNLTIKELTPPATKTLLDQNELSKWTDPARHQGAWSIKALEQPVTSILGSFDHYLHYQGSSPARDKDLWTKDSFANFILDFNWRWSGEGQGLRPRPVLDPTTGSAKRDQDGNEITEEVIEYDSGVYLRGNTRSQVNLWNWPCGSGEVWGYRTDPNLPQEIRADLTPKVKADSPIGEWNAMSIILINDRLTVFLNGQAVIEHAELPNLPKKGPIGLQNHGNAIDFADLQLHSF